VYTSGWASAHDGDAGADPRDTGFSLPNSSRAAWVTAEIGFHSANTCNGAGNVLSGTNVLAMKVSGKITMKAALLTTSGLGTSIPIQAMIQETA